MSTENFQAVLDADIDTIRSKEKQMRIKAKKSPRLTEKIQLMRTSDEFGRLLCQMILDRFDVEDAVQVSIQSRTLFAFERFAPHWPKCYEALKQLIQYQPKPPKEKT